MQQSVAEPRNFDIGKPGKNDFNISIKNNFDILILYSRSIRLGIGGLQRLLAIFRGILVAVEGRWDGDSGFSTASVEP